jgi:hypothetical protein
MDIPWNFGLGISGQTGDHCRAALDTRKRDWNRLGLCARNFCMGARRARTSSGMKSGVAMSTVQADRPLDLTADTVAHSP